MTPSRPAGSWLRYAIAAYDRLYRWRHGLDRPESIVGPVLRVTIARSRGDVQLRDGVMIRRGEAIGVLHLNNERIRALHTGRVAAGAVGLTFRRQFIASLEELAARMDEGGPLVHVRACTATTILHHGLSRLGFATARGGSNGSALVGAYQRVLLASLRPAGRARLDVAMRQRAQSVWMSREELRARFARRLPLPR